MRKLLSPNVWAPLASLSLAACAQLGGAPASASGDPWSLEYQPPQELDTERVHLEPLAPKHVELDFAALMGSREHLQSTLHWGNWPSADFTVEENRVDLERHWQEFQGNQGYAYTVLSPDRERCLGCIYLMPSDGEGWEMSAEMAYWVIESELASELDRHLLENLLTWFDRAWAFDQVRWMIHEDNARGLQLAADADLAEVDAILPGHRGLLWRADA